MGIDFRAIEPAHVLLAVAAAMAYLLARDLGASKRVATVVGVGVAFLMLFVK